DKRPYSPWASHIGWGKTRFIQRIVMALNAYPSKPAGIRQTGPAGAPAPGGWPPQQTAGVPPVSYGPPAPFPPVPGQPVAGAGGAAGGLFGGLNLGQIKQLIDRMGGIDGVLNTLSKVQKIVQSVQQLAPMLRLLLPKSAAKTYAEEDDEEWVPRRPKRRRRTGAAGARIRRTSGGRHGKRRTSGVRTGASRRRAGRRP